MVFFLSSSPPALNSAQSNGGLWENYLQRWSLSGRDWPLTVWLNRYYAVYYSGHLFEWKERDGREERGLKASGLSHTFQCGENGWVPQGWNRCNSWSPEGKDARSRRAWGLFLEMKWGGSGRDWAQWTTRQVIVQQGGCDIPAGPLERAALAPTLLQEAWNNFIPGYLPPRGPSWPVILGQGGRNCHERTTVNKRCLSVSIVPLPCAEPWKGNEIQLEKMTSSSIKGQCWEGRRDEH